MREERHSKARREAAAGEYEHGSLAGESVHNRAALDSRLQNLDSLCEFITRLFKPHDVVEVRAIESWLGEDGKRCSRVLCRAWHAASDLPLQYDSLRELNERCNANIYFGVNPRRALGDAEPAIARGLWADIDGRAPELALPLPPVVPCPSMVVSSGSGTHLYWRLAEPIVLTTKKRDELEATLRNLYRIIGGDSVQDAKRLMRLPGFLNCKNAKNGELPRPCDVVSVSGERVPYSLFSPWREAQQTVNGSGHLENGAVRPCDERTRKRIEGVLRRLDRDDVKDRSRRDFGAVMLLFEFGLSAEEVKSLVQSRSKFLGNDAYLDLTIRKALAAMKG